MKLKSILLNLVLTSLSIYLPLSFFSFFDFYTSKRRTTYLERTRELNIDIPQKISAINSGYLPLFYPEEVINKFNPIGFYPIASLPLSKTYYCNEGYGLITYQSDRFGLRNRDLKWSNIYNQPTIFMLGDSFIHGSCVPDYSTIPVLVEKSLKINTINLATASTGPYEYMAVIRSILQPIIQKSTKDTTVIVSFYANDNEPFDYNKEKLLNSTKSIVEPTSYPEISPTKEYISSIKSLILNNYPKSEDDLINKLNERVNNLYKDSFLYQIVTLVPVRDKLKNFHRVLSNSSKTEQNSASESPSERTLLLLKDICKNSCLPIVAYIPNSNYWRPDSNSKNYKREIEKLSLSLNITFVDGEDVIDSNNINDFAPKGPHLSIEGYKKFSDLIIDKLSSLK